MGDGPLRFNVVCGFCGLLLDSYTLADLTTGSWNEAALWGALAHDTHRPNCTAHPTA